MNSHGITAIYRFEMARWKRTLWQSLITPVITTALYFVVFGSALGSRMTDMHGVSFGAFIVPGLTLLSVFMQSIFNASFGIYFPKFTGTIYELLSAPISSFEAVLAYVGAAVTKSVILALVTLVTAAFFVPVRVDHPAAMILFLRRDQHRLLPVRLRDRRVGAKFRAAADHPDAGDHAADLPRRRLLLGRDAAASPSGRSLCSTRSSTSSAASAGASTRSPTCPSGPALRSPRRSSPSAWR